MRIAVDTTPATNQKGGVGRYTRELLRALVQETLDHQYVLSASARESDIECLLDFLPPGAWREVRRLPACERIMTGLWQRARLPISIERWIGPHDLFHGTDFVLPPTQSKRVVTIHDLSFLVCPQYCHPDLAAYLQSAVPRAVRDADIVITVSASVAAELAGMFPGARGKIVAIPNGVDLPVSRTGETPGTQPTVLMVGTIEPRKNHVTVLRAMDEVRVRFSDAQLIVIGRRGWLDNDTVSELKTGQVQGWLTWLDDADDQQLADAYERATVSVSASYYEGFGLPVLEAMARGIPGVVSDIAAHREVARETVRYAPANDVSAFASEIIDLLDNADNRASLAEAGAQRARRFSWRETARRTLRAYALAAGGSSA